MIVTIHQPEHLPWLGFFHKMALAERYIVLDHVQYRHRYFQNRNRILGPDGPEWLTVPVLKQQHRYGPIHDVVIDASRDWRKDYWGTLERSYQKHPFFDLYAARLRAIVSAPHERLVSLNLALIEFFRDAFEIRTPLVSSSTLAAEGAKSALLHQLVVQTGGQIYLSGPSGRDYLDEAPFWSSGIDVRYHAFEHPVYDQRGRTSFETHLSALDLLMNHGPASAQLFMPDGAPMQRLCQHSLPLSERPTLRNLPIPA